MSIFSSAFSFLIMLTCFSVAGFSPGVVSLEGRVGAGVGQVEVFIWSLFGWSEEANKLVHARALSCQAIRICGSFFEEISAMLTTC